MGFSLTFIYPVVTVYPAFVAHVTSVTGPCTASQNSYDNKPYMITK